MNKQNLVAKCEEQIIDDMIKICVSCGSTLVIIENNTMTCRICKKQFKIKGRENGHSLQ